MYASPWRECVVREEDRREAIANEVAGRPGGCWKWRLRAERLKREWLVNGAMCWSQVRKYKGENISLAVAIWKTLTRTASGELEVVEY